MAGWPSWNLMQEATPVRPRSQERGWMARGALKKM